MKKTFLFLAALLTATVFNLNATDMDTLFLNTGGSTLWNQGGAKFSIFYWNDGEAGEFTDFLALAYGETDIYRAIIPKKDSVIFVRHAATADVPTWDNKLHQTKSDEVDLEIGNIMVITSWDPADREWDYYTPKQAPAGPDMHDMLYFVGLNGNDTVRLNKYATNSTLLAKLTATFEYSKDRINWSTYSWATSAEPTNTYQGAAIALAKGDSVFFRAKGTNGLNATMSNGNAAYFQFAFGVDDQIAAGGNAMSLYDASCEQDTMTACGFVYMFKMAKQLVSASELKLPATTLANYCYQSMFNGCTSLTQAPELKATTLASSCYTQMFNNCTSLTTAPELNATTLAQQCYMGMFMGCTSLTQAPKLKATTLAMLCYGAMFTGCTSLQVDTCADGSCDGVKFEPTHSATTAPNSWNINMFKDCKGTITTPQLGGHYCIKEYKDTLDYLHFVGLNGNDTVRLNKYATTKNLAKLTATFEYSKDRINWSTYSWATSAEPTNTYQGAAIALAKGDSVFFRAKGTKGLNATMNNNASTRFTFAFGADDQIAAGGNIMSLYDATCEQDTMTSMGFYSLFLDAKQLVSAPKLPAKKLAGDCYVNMFYGCSNLTAAPALPATTLANSCYNSMFRYCTALTQAPALPADTLANYCYSKMFNGCTSLTKAPELKATTLANLCYSNMFNGCTSLEVNSFSGSCDGAELVVPTVSGTAPTDWNWDMFTGCKGDAALTAEFGIQLGGHYCIKGYKDMHDFLYFVGLNGNDTVRLNKFAANSTNLANLTATFEYSKDRINWSTYSWATAPEPANTYQGAAIALAKGDSVFFRAKGTNGLNATLSNGLGTYFQFAFGTDDSIAAGGNAMSLYDASCEQDTMTAYGFVYMFKMAKQLVSAPKLPTTQLANYCYQSMFSGCTSLTQAPELKATTLASSCYTQMFYDCTSLTTAPELNATTLAKSCYMGMFMGCTSLTQAPKLKATTLAMLCYGTMFAGCTSLQVDTCADGSCDGVKFEPTHSATTAPNSWNINMFKDCKGTITTPQLGGHYCIKEYVDTLDYLHFVSLKPNGTVKLNKGSNAPACNVEYSKDNRKSWTAYTWTGTNGDPIALGLNDTVWFRAGGTTGKNTAFASTNNAASSHFFVFGENDSIAAEGNIVSLLDASLKQADCADHAFDFLFQNCSALVSAPELTITTLGAACYCAMFQNCTSLKAAPALPAESLALLCYGLMFDGCTSLIQAPELKATTLAMYCYMMMFNNCTSLQVDTLSGDCNGAVLEVPSSSPAYAYAWNSDMFKGCKGTVTEPQLGGHYCIKEYVPVITGVSLTGFDDTYDGENHSVEVSGTEEGDKIEFSADSATWQSTNPSFKSVVDTLIYVRVQRAGYQDWGGSAKITITPKQVTVGGQYVKSKIYDGNTTATIIIDELEHVVEGDDVTVSATGEFEDKNVGESKDVSVVYTLGGNDVGNYYMDEYTETLPGDILVREIMLQSADLEKEYDGKALTADSQTGGTTITDLTAGQTNNGYVDGECFTYSNFTGSQLIIGESDNTFDVSDSETALVSNYNITKEYGKLKVTALDPIAYIDANGQEQTCVQYIIVEDTTAQVTWNEGWYVVNDTITLSAGAVCNGAVNLILADGAVLTATGGTNAGIEVSGTGNTLTIYGQSELTGKLSASSVAEYSCGIGYSNNGDDAESIVVAANWTITADGAEVTHTTTANIAQDIAGFQVVKINIVDPSGIQSIRGNNADQPSKFIQNGQLIIIRNGKMFNAQGAVVD